MTKVNRREFLASVAGASLVYTFRVNARAAEYTNKKPSKIIPIDEICAASESTINYSEWIVLENSGKVSVFTGRTELGQGLRTVLTGVVLQALEIDDDMLTVHLGNTDVCPDDGATNGSSATGQVVWPHWQACLKIKEDITSKGASALNLPESEVYYQGGKVIAKDDESRFVHFSSFSPQGALKLELNHEEDAENRVYQDKGMKNVLARDIVRGKLKFVGDKKVKGMVYGGYKMPPYISHLTKLISADFTDTLQVDGVIDAGIVRNMPAVFAESYRSLQEGLKKVKARWQRPDRPRKVEIVKETREGAQLYEVKEQNGDVEKGFSISEKVVSETYYTHPIQSTPLETDTAVAAVGRRKTNIWVSSQYPHHHRRDAANRLGIDVEKVHVEGMQVGGGFGGKISNPSPADTALLSQFIGRPVKYVYNREDQFLRRGRAKECCVIDLTTGVNLDGKINARKIDIYQDEGNGTDDVYSIDNVDTKLYRTAMPLKHAVIRGTSYMQNIFAVESHVDEVAHSIDMDPLEFRLKNVAIDAYRDLLNRGAEMIDYGNCPQTEDNCTGIAVINHGSNELGALFVNLAVNPSNGVIDIRKICGVFDIGIVMNRITATTGIMGAIIWGLGYGLMEEIKFNGHKIKTTKLSKYDLPRFSDIPPIEVDFIKSFPSDRPRGCGEMPAPPVTPAIGNAIRRATGVRLYQTPFKAKSVKKALNS